MVELGELESHHPEFKKRNVEIVVVSNDDLPTAQATKKDFPNLLVVSDAKFDLARAMQVVHPGAGPQQSDTNAPTTFLVDGAGYVRWLFRPDQTIARLSAEELLAAIDKTLPPR